MASGNQNVLIFEKTPEQEQEELTSAAAPLTAFNFPATIFNREAAINAGFTHKIFLKLVQTVARFKDGDQLPQVVSLGVKQNIFTIHTMCDLKQFVAFSRFLKSKEGQDAIVGINKHAKLKKRAAGVFEPSDVALETLLQMQRQDYSRVLKSEMLEYAKKIADLKMEIRRLQERMELRKEEVIAAFVPASVQAKMAQGGQDYAINNNGQLGKMARDIEFVKEGENSKMLFEYAKSKLLSFREQYDVKGERNLKNLLASAGAGEIVDQAQALGLYKPRGVTPEPSAGGGGRQGCAKKKRAAGDKDLQQ